jgi:hypothetical protein
VSGFGQNTSDTSWYEWRVMRKKKADEESFQATLVAVKKEMAKPLMATSARRAKTNRAPGKRDFRKVPGNPTSHDLARTDSG